MTVLSRILGGQKTYTKLSCPLSSNHVDLQVMLYEVLGKYRILPGAYKIIILNSAHTITSFKVFVINIIKINVRLEELPSLLT